MVIFYFSLITLTLVGPYATWHWVMPKGIEWFWLALVGISTYFAQYLMTRAYHAERVAVVANFNYTGVLYALIFGWLFFHEAMALGSLFGMVFIISGVILGSRMKAQYETENSQEKKPELTG